MKGDGGAVGLTESPAALQTWMVSGPEMARLINDFEASIHHSKDTVECAIMNSVQEYKNPFFMM